MKLLVNKGTQVPCKEDHLLHSQELAGGVEGIVIEKGRGHLESNTTYTILVEAPRGTLLTIVSRQIQSLMSTTL